MPTLSRKQVPCLGWFQTFRDPRIMYNRPELGVDAIIAGVVGLEAQTRDAFISKEVTEHLFAENPPHGLGEDLMSLNLQRGRDHGLPGERPPPPQRVWARVEKNTINYFYFTVIFFNIWATANKCEVNLFLSNLIMTLWTMPDLALYH